MSTTSLSAIDDQLNIIDTLASRHRIMTDITLADLVNYHSRSQQPFHRWFRYREGYSPDLVFRAIDDFGRRPDLILDPFCGSGTTLMAAQNRDIAAIGFDINPVSVLVARAKTRVYNDNHLRSIEDHVEALGNLRPDLAAAPVPDLSIIHKVFRDDILHALLSARFIIDNVSDLVVKDFLLVGWLSILEEVSNVFKEGNGIKYRNRKRTPHGYITVPWDELNLHTDDGFDLVGKHLSERYRMMLDDLKIGSRGIEPSIIQGSALNLARQVARESVSLCIFSPPYCNNFNYMKIFKVELWMGNFVNSYADIRVLNQLALRSHVEMMLAIPDTPELPSQLLELVSLIRGAELWNRKIPDAIIAYFLDMKETLLQVWNSLHKNGTCQVVVGNSAYGGVVIPTDLVLAEIASAIGFEVEKLVVARHLTTSSQQRIKLGGKLHLLRESIIHLKKR